MKKISILIIALVIGFGANAQKKSGKTPANKPAVQVIKSSTTSINNSKMSYKNTPGMYATFETDKGNIVIALEYKKCPMTVCNFVALAEGKMETKVKSGPFYDGLKFHRVITVANGDAQDFMIQGGCPLGTGTGDPGYKFPDEFDASLKHDKPGIFSMANSGPGTNGSQFFITVVATPWLDNKHSVFGNVVEGMDVCNKIKKDDLLKKVKIERIGKDAEAFKADQATMNTMIGSINERKSAGMVKDKADFAAYVKTNHPKAITLPSGLAYVMEKTGTGDKAVAGKDVSVHYHGAFTDGKKFDASYDRNQPIDFKLGQGMVIPGWEEGIALLNKGAKAKLIIPYWLAYGVDGRAPVIPAKSTLIFDTELVDIK